MPGCAAWPPRRSVTIGHPSSGASGGGRPCPVSGTAITALALQTLVLVTLDGGAAQVGWLNSARWLPYLVLGLVVGALVDRVRRRPVMVATDLARAGLLGLIPLAWAFDVLTFPLLLVVVLLFGTVSLVNDAASLSFVPRLVPRHELQRAHARLDGAGAVAQTAGPALAGALIRVLGAPLAVLVDAATYLFSAVMVASLKGVAEPAATRPARLGARGLAAEVRDGARWAYGGSGLRRLAVSTHVWFAGQAVLLVLVVPYGYLELDLTPVPARPRVRRRGPRRAARRRDEHRGRPSSGRGRRHHLRALGQCARRPHHAGGGVGADRLGRRSGPGRRTAVPRLGDGDQQLP